MKETLTKQEIENFSLKEIKIITEIESSQVNINFIID